MDQRHSWRGGTSSCGGGKLDAGLGQLSFQFQLLKRWRRNWSISGRRTGCSRDQLGMEGVEDKVDKQGGDEGREKSVYDGSDNAA